MKQILIILIIHFSATALLASAFDGTFTGVIQHPSIEGACNDGRIDLSLNEGFSPFDIHWYKIEFGGSTETFLQSAYQIQGNNDGEDISGLESGTYKVVMNDAMCGRAFKTFFLEECSCSTPCNINENITDATCDKKGSIEVNMDCEETSHFPFSYSWSDGPSTANRTDLDMGMYTLTATDAFGCEYIRDFTIGGENVLEIHLINKDNIKECRREGENACTGSIDIGVNNTQNNSYSWSNGATTQDITGLCEGIYTVTVTSESGCTDTYSTEICCCREDDGNFTNLGNCYPEYLAPLSIESDINGLPNANIFTNIVGGTENYSCVWTGPNGFTSFSCQGLVNISREGQYCLTVDDGCHEISECFNIVDCSKYEVSIYKEVTKTCYGVNAGSINLSISGGAPPYQFTWSNGTTSSNISNLSQGEYCVTIKDANGCPSPSYTECIMVGAVHGEIQNSTIPCSSTTFCNGQEFTSYANYIQSYNCNILQSYCPITGETIYEDLGWAGYTSSNCNLYGICQSGQQVYLATGNYIPGPHLFSEPIDCGSGILCVDYLCEINRPDLGLTGTFIPDNAQVNCASVVYSNFSGCSPDPCLAQVFCDNSSTPIDQFCIDYGCTNANKREEDIIVKFENLPELPPYFNDYINESLEDKNQEVSELSSDENVLKNKFAHTNFKIFPNPAKTHVEIKPKKDNTAYSFVVVNSLGNVIFEQNALSGTHTLDLQNLPHGIYFIKIMMKSGYQRVYKILKE